MPANDLLPLAEESFQSLMDQALKTKDFAWCKELMDKFKGQTKVS
jgi:hypothetical protein